MRKIFLSIFSFVLAIHALAQTASVAHKVDSVIRLMTLEEKIGQLNQYSGDWAHTGPITPDGDKQNEYYFVMHFHCTLVLIPYLLL